VTRNADLQKALGTVGVEAIVAAPDAEWAAPQSRHDSLLLVARTLQENLIPRVVGMGAMDAIFLLENLGLQVRMVGSGVVRRQSIIPGTRATKGREIIIELS
jgi:cell division protein FtsI (penicillin-binding protein 3)